MAHATSLHRAEVSKLLVHPAHQRQGIGRALLAACERISSGLGRTMLHLDTREGDASNALYRAASWTEADHVPHWCLAADGRWLAADGRSLAAAMFYVKALSGTVSSPRLP